MVSFGHAAYFGLGAYGAALLFKNAGWSMETSLLAAPLVAAIGGAISDGLAFASPVSTWPC